MFLRPIDVSLAELFNLVSIIFFYFISRNYYKLSLCVTFNNTFDKLHKP